MKENLKEELFNKIEILKPQLKDIIALYYNADSVVVDLDNIWSNVNLLSERYPQNTIIALPNEVGLKLLSINELKQLIKMTQEVIDKMEALNEIYE
jgi:predicted xylose isomerase-like sugar epimerase